MPGRVFSKTPRGSSKSDAQAHRVIKHHAQNNEKKNEIINLNKGERIGLNQLIRQA